MRLSNPKSHLALTLAATALALSATSSQAGMISHWKLDDAVGTDPIVDSVSGHNAAQTGSPTLGLAGKAGTAGSFASGANYYLTDPSADFSQTEFTFSFWFNPLNSGGGYYNVAISNRTGENGFIVYQRNDQLEYWLKDPGGSWQGQTVGIQRGVDQWYHVVGSRDASGTKKFYVTLESEASATPDATMTGTGAVMAAAPKMGIGVRGDGGLPLNGGYLDDVQFYDVALSDSEVNWLFNNPGQGVPTWDGANDNWGTAAHWSTGAVPDLATGNDSARIESGTVTYTPGDDFIINNGNSLNLTGGSFVKSAPRWIGIGENSEGTVNQTGGVFDASGVNNVRLGFNSGGVGNYNLDGGTLIVRLIDQGSGQANFSADGGTLQAAASFSTPLPMTINGGGLTVDTDGNDVTLSGALVAGTGSGGLTKNGAGTLTISGANSYGGPTVVNDGKLVLARGTWSANSHAGGSLLINPGAEAEITASHPFGYWGRPVEINEATLTMTAGGYINGLTMTGGTLAGGLNNWLGLTAHASPNTATVTGKINLLNGNEEFSVADGAQDVDLWMQGGVGDVSWWGGTAGLRKTGDGTMLLEGDSSLGSTTTVEAGTLLVDGTLASAGATVTGGWLGGHGTIDSDLEIQAAGNISAGASPGHLSVTGDYLQGGTMLVEIAGTAQGDPAGYDWIDVAGEATFEVGATLDVDFLGGFQPVMGDQFVVFTAAGGITNADISEIAFDLTDAQSMFRLNPALIPWGAGGGEAIVLTAVPEPSALALLACGLLGLVMVRRRR